MHKVSVIVPVYNVEKYLDRCLNSLVNQTLDDFEIIVINDGSPDNSQVIIDEYQKKYPNLIKKYYKDNGGLSSTRNYGIERSNGEYISFIDSDDYIEPTMLEVMYNKAIEENYDVVVCNLNYVYEDGAKDRIVSCNLNYDVLNRNSLKKSMINIYPTACNKIFKRKIFDYILFKEKIWYEDVEFIYRMYSVINSIGVVKLPLYNYLQRKNTITSTFNDKIFDYIDNWNGIIEYYKKINLYEEFYNELEYCYVRYILATMVKGLTNFNNYQKYLLGVDRALFNVKNNFPNYKKNKYFYRSAKGIYLIMFNKMFARLMYKGENK